MTFRPTILAVFLALFPLMLFAQTTRQQVLFNEGWKFHKGDADSAQQLNFNEGDWRSISLPHDWSVEGSFSQEWASGTGYLPGGIGWYRKTFGIPSGWQDKQVYVYFDGVYKNSEVWINGHSLGKRPNGFISFQYELTPYLKPGNTNIIAVKADHSKFADSRWYTGSGIYRNVYLVSTNPVHVALYGVQFTTPVVSAEDAVARVDITLDSAIKAGVPVLVKAVLSEKNGRQVARGQQQVTTTANGSTTAGISLSVAKPQLWSVHNPALYALTVTLTSQGKKMDELTETVGIRSIRFDPSQGFFLNGRNMKMNGVCIHDDAGVLGVAVPEEVWIRRLNILRQGGCNALRLSHNPHADYLYRLADEMGFLVIDEAFDEWDVGKNKWIAGWNKGTPGKDGYHEYFKEWADRDLRDMILRNRNRPSVIMWSIGNEIDYPNDPYSHEILSTGRNPQIYGKGYLPDHPPASRLGDISKHLVAVAKQYDTTRPVTAALAGVVMSNTTTYPENLDVVGYNYQDYRYPDDHQKYPSRIIYDSENGMGLRPWKAVDSNQYVSGQFLWTGIDYLGEAGLWPQRSNGAGLLNLAGFPKPEYHFRQALWSREPIIYMGSLDIPKAEDPGIWSHRRAEPQWNRNTGDSVRVNCFTNCEEAELFLNNKSLGRKALADAREKMLFWDLVYQPGVLEVKGYRGGKEVSRYSLATPGKPAAIKAVEYLNPMIPKGGKFKQVEVSITDDQGRTVYGANDEITVNIRGKASMLGIETGNSSDVGDYKSNKKKMMNGSAIVYVMADNNSGPFEVSITSGGLKGAVLKFGR